MYEILNIATSSNLTYPLIEDLLDFIFNLTLYSIGGRGA